MNTRAAFLLACVLAWIPRLACEAMPADGGAGRLPLAYLTEPGAHPWTGRLRAVGWQLSPRGDARQAPQGLWEAGALLDARHPASRRIFTSLEANASQPERLTALHWHELDDATRQMLAAEELAWLRGDNATPRLRPRDTRMSSARGARVLVVAPPLWQPGRPGHTSFRERNRQRPHVVWVGTVDALLHGFDALTGEEHAAYLPRTLIPLAAEMASPAGRHAPNPCPHPESTDAVVAGEWRTLLLCGFHADAESVAGVFALDVTDPSAPQPLKLLWEIAATPALPLSGKGPVRAAALRDGHEQRWHAVAMLEPQPDEARGPGSQAGLALLAMDKPRSAMSHSHLTVPIAHLPERGCDGTPATTRLRGVTISADMTGMALAAYATDDAGQLWRFDLRDLLRQPTPAPASCLHRLRTGPAVATVVPPMLLGAPAQPLIVYGAGNELAAIPDRPASPAHPVRIVAYAQDEGFVLRAMPAQDGTNPAAGWHLVLPDASEQVELVDTAAPGYLYVLTRLPDGRQRGYLVLAATGESLGRLNDGAPLLHYATGHSLGLAGTLTLTRDSVAIVPPVAGAPGRDASALALWSVDSSAATRLTQAVASRRTGRLAWRELAGPVQEAPP